MTQQPTRCLVKAAALFPFLFVTRLLASTVPAIVDLGGATGRAISSAEGINDNGDIVVIASTHPYDDRAFVYSNRKVVNMGVLPSGSYSGAVDINSKGEVAGYSG